MRRALVWARAHKRDLGLVLMVLGVEQVRNLLLNHDQRLEKLETDGRVPVDDLVTVGELDRRLAGIARRRDDTEPDGA
jgi:hypothetical protein